MANVGESLSSYKGIDFLTGSSPEELKAQLSSIQLPFKLITIYAQGSNHVAWIIPTIPLKKTKKGTT